MSSEPLAHQAADQLRDLGTRARVVPPRLGESEADLVVTMTGDETEAALQLVRRDDPGAYRVPGE